MRVAERGASSRAAPALEAARVPVPVPAAAPIRGDSLVAGAAPALHRASRFTPALRPVNKDMHDSVEQQRPQQLSWLQHLKHY